MNPIKPGGIWWIDRVISPHNLDESKSRRMLVIHHEKVVPNGLRTELFVAGITTSPNRAQLTSGLAIQLPDRTRYPNTQSGLTEPCWVVADWVVTTTPCKLETQAGFIKIDIVLEVQRLMRENGIKPVRMVCGPADGQCDYCK